MLRDQYIETSHLNNNHQNLYTGKMCMQYYVRKLQSLQNCSRQSVGMQSLNFYFSPKTALSEFCITIKVGREVIERRQE